MDSVSRVKSLSCRGSGFYSHLLICIWGNCLDSSGLGFQVLHFSWWLRQYYSVFTHAQVERLHGTVKTLDGLGMSWILNLVLR